MKVAEALAERKALRDRLTSLSNRARKSVLAAEGKSPMESAAMLLDDITQVLEQWEARVIQINRANATIRMDNGMTLMEALARRDRLSEHIAVLDDVMAVVLGPGHERLGMMPREMTQMVPTIDVNVLQQRIDSLKRERMDLDLAIQEAGWTHEI